MKNFTISLYAFHLCKRLTDAPKKVAPEAKLLWESLAELGKESLPLPELKNLRSRLICYDDNDNYNPDSELQKSSGCLAKTESQDETSIELGSVESELGYKIEGSLEAFRLNDTYFADLTLSPESADIAIEPSQFQKLQFQHLLPTKINSSLGQTIWIYGEIEKPDDECKNLAESYALALLEGSEFADKLELVSTSKLFGSLLFEYAPKGEEKFVSFGNKYHILVWINNSQAPTLEVSQPAYKHLRNWLWNRHKIVCVYSQSRAINENCRQIYSELEAEIQQFSRISRDNQKRLKYLKALLNDLPEKCLKYSCEMRDLQAQLTTLNTNTKNYQNSKENIIKLGGGEDLELWQRFSKDIELWPQQIQIDLEYLEPGKELFDRILETARGIAEIDQAESDRSLEKTIQILGVALGAGGIFVACYVEYADIPVSLKPTGKLSTIHPLASSLFLTILFALFAGIITWWLVRDKSK